MIKPWISLTISRSPHDIIFSIHHNTNSALKCDVCYEEKLINLGSNYSYKQDVCLLVALELFVNIRIFAVWFSTFHLSDMIVF